MNKELILDWLSDTNYTLFLVLIPIFILFGYPLSSSLWLDETITYWIASADISTIFQRVFQYQGQSPLYFIEIHLLIKQLGASEWVLRLPSILAAAGSCFFLFKITRQYLDREGAAIALLIFYNLDGVVKAAVNARPYSIALFLLLGTVYFFMLWLKNRRNDSLILTSLFLSSLFYHHYLYLSVGLILLVLLYTSERKLEKGDWVRLFIAVGLCALAFVPGIAHLAHIISVSETYKFPRLPEISSLLKALFPPFLTVSILFCMIFTRIFFKFGIKPNYNYKTVNLFLIWFLFPPILYFAYSWYSGGSLFFWRFYLWYSPALAILAAMFIRSIDPKNARALVVSMLCIFTFLAPRDWRIENWKELPKVLNQDFAADTPVLLYSGLVEADNLNWIMSKEKHPYLTSPFQFYSINREVIPIPSSLNSPELEQFLETRLIPTLELRDEFILVSSRMRQHRISGEKLPDHFISELEKYGFKSTPILVNGLIWVHRISSTT